MGTGITSWDDFLATMGEEGNLTGTYYVGNGGSEWLWLIVSIVLCGLALFMGLAHEKMAYRKAAQK